MDANSIMPCWYYEKKELRNTPSIQDGIDYETECRYRKEGARFIIDTGTKMDLGYNTMATGVVYFHRFYMYHSFRNFPRYVTACCCLFLAGKVEETPKKCKDIIKTAKSLLTEQKFATFGEDPKEEVMTLERILLQTIKFDLQVEHPYSFLLKYAKSLKGDKVKLHKMVQMAWTFVNDSLCTTLCLQWEPEVIAVALMYLAGKLSKFEVVDWIGRTSKHLRWWDMFVEDITMDLLEDICHQVLDLYSQPQNAQPPDSPPLVRNPLPKKEPLPVPVYQHSSPAAPAGSLEIPCKKSLPLRLPVPDSPSPDNETGSNEIPPKEIINNSIEPQENVSQAMDCKLPLNNCSPQAPHCSSHISSFVTQNQMTNMPQNHQVFSNYHHFSQPPPGTENQMTSLPQLQNNQLISNYHYFSQPPPVQPLNPVETRLYKNEENALIKGEMAFNMTTTDPGERFSYPVYGKPYVATSPPEFNPLYPPPSFFATGFYSPFNRPPPNHF